MDALRVQPDVGVMARTQVRLRIGEHRSIPFVATVCGYPVLAGDLTGMAAMSDGNVALEIRPAGPWSALLARGRLSTGVGKNWLLLGAQPYARACVRT